MLLASPTIAEETKCANGLLASALCVWCVVLWCVVCGVCAEREDEHHKQASKRKFKAERGTHERSEATHGVQLFPRSYAPKFRLTGFSPALLEEFSLAHLYFGVCYFDLLFGPNSFHLCLALPFTTVSTLALSTSPLLPLPPFASAFDRASPSDAAITSPRFSSVTSTVRIPRALASLHYNRDPPCPPAVNLPASAFDRASPSNAATTSPRFSSLTSTVRIPRTLAALRFRPMSSKNKI